LLVSPHYSPEPFRVADAAAGLVRRGHEVHVLTALPNYPAGRFYEGYGLLGPYRESHDGVEIHRVPVVPRGRGGALRLVLNYASFALAATARALSLGRRRWDVVFVVQLTPVTAIVPAAVLRAVFGTPVVAWVQDLWPESISATGFGRHRFLVSAARALSGWLYRRCDRVLGTSPAFGPRLDRLGVATSRFEYLPQWAEDFFGRGGDSSSPPGGEWSSGFPIMFAGNLGRAQALDTIIEAASLVRDDSAIRWVFLGDGSRREWLEGEVRRRGLERSVFLLGRRPAAEMPSFFANAGAMLVSLKRDDTMALTIPAKIQSYLAFGRPVLASMDGEGARVVEDSGAGWAAPGDDAVGLAEIVRRMKNLPAAERAAMGARGRAYSRLHFDREACLDRLDRALDAMASSRPPGSRSPCSSG
jgi:glycosyltransferase involved in cell wall biosynthesis